MTDNDKSAECLRMVAYLSEYLDGELDEALRKVVERHGGECPPCEKFFRTMSRTVEIVREQPREPLPDELKKKLADALRRASRH